MTDQNDTIDPTVHGTEAINKVAFDECLKPALALGEDDHVHPTFDAGDAVSAVFGKLPALAAIRADIGDLKRYDHALYDDLERRARALRYADMRYQVAIAPLASIDEPIAELDKQVDILAADTRGMIARGVMPERPFSTFKFTKGARNTVENAMRIVLLWREHWPRICMHTTVTEKALRDVEATAEQYDVEIAEREAQPKRIAEAARDRRALISYFMLSYYEVERGLYFLFPKTFDEYLPNIYNRGGARKKAGEAQPAELPAASASAKSSNESGVVTLSEDVDANVATGMPGSSPILGKK